MGKIACPKHYDNPVASIPQEILALFTAITHCKNVTINPYQYPISLVGKVRKETPRSERLATLDSGLTLYRRVKFDQIVTSDICSIYFEKVIKNEKESMKLHVHTRNTDYCLGDIDGILQSPFCKYLAGNDLEIEDYERFFSDINDDYQIVEIGA